MVRRICSCWRSLPSRRRLAATSALTARPAIETPIVNVTNSRNDSMKVAANKPQAANPERMSAVVAVSRGPHRSAAHNNGTTARNPSALLNAVCSISGLKAITPTIPAAASTVADASTVFRLKGRKSPRAQSTTTGATARTPAASRSHHVDHAAMMPVHSRYPASDKPPIPAVALIIVVARTTKTNFATPAGVSKVLRPPHQMLTRYPPTTGARVLPVATTKDIGMESTALSLTRSVGTPATYAAAKIAGHTRIPHKRTAAKARPAGAQIGITLEWIDATVRLRFAKPK